MLELELALNEVTVEGARALAQALGRLPRLQRLSLQENELENAGAIALAQGLRELKDLRELHLTQNQVIWHSYLFCLDAVLSGARLACSPEHAPRFSQMAGVTAASGFSSNVLVIRAARHASGLHLAEHAGAASVQWSV